jgi:hypothetical protein
LWPEPDEPLGRKRALKELIDRNQGANSQG